MRILTMLFLLGFFLVPTLAVAGGITMPAGGVINIKEGALLVEQTDIRNILGKGSKEQRDVRGIVNKIDEWFVLEIKQPNYAVYNLVCTTLPKRIFLECPLNSDIVGREVSLDGSRVFIANHRRIIGDERDEVFLDRPVYNFTVTDLRILK